MNTPAGPAAPSRRRGVWWQAGFRWFWFGETVSKIGSTMTVVAMPLVGVLVLNASTFTVGLLQAAVWFPWLVLALPAGALVDRLPKRPLMLVCDGVSFVAFVSVPVAAWLGWLSTTQLLVVALVAGMSSVFFLTAYQPLLPSLLAREQLPAANAMLQGSEAAAEMIGPGLAGIVAQLLGAVTALLADAVSFAVSAVCLTRVRPRPATDAAPPRKPLVAEIRDGLAFIIRDPYLRTYSLYAGAANFAEMMGMAVMVPFLVRSVGLSPGITGTVMAIGGVGGVLGASVSARVGRLVGTARGILLCEAVAMTTGLLIPFTTAGQGVVLFIVGEMGLTSGIIATNIIFASFRQSYVPARLLGRVSSAARLVSVGATPLGALAGAALGQAFGPRTAVATSAVGTVLSVLILVASPMRRNRDLPTAPPAEPAR